MCLSTLECTNVTSPPVLKLWDGQGYPWLPHGLAELIKLIGVTYNQRGFFFKKVSYVIPSILLSLQIFVIQTSSHLPPIPEGQENLLAESTVFASTYFINYV